MTFVRGIQVPGARRAAVRLFWWSRVTAAVPLEVVRSWRMRVGVLAFLRNLKLLITTLQTWSAQLGEWRRVTVEQRSSTLGAGIRLPTSRKLAGGGLQASNRNRTGANS